MSKHLDQIQRLGFEAWADSQIVNALEGLDVRSASYLDERDDMTVFVRVEDGMAYATVRAHVNLAGNSWHVHTREVRIA